MADTTVQPYTGPQTIDIAAIAPQLVDLAPGAMRGLRRELEGMSEVVSELQSAVPVLGPKVGISSDVYADFEQVHALIGKIREARLVVDKVAEALQESEAYYADQREVAISLIAGAVRTSARQRDASFRAAFEKTLATTRKSR